jgi:hypothetical protein
MVHEKLKFFAAGEQFWKFMVDGLAERMTVQECGWSMMGQARQKGRVRIFGEMVAVLPMGRRAHPSRLSFGRGLEPVGDGTTLISLVCLSHVEVLRGKRQGSLIAISQLQTIRMCIR